MQVDRRTFLRSAATATAATVPFARSSTALTAAGFNDEFGYAVTTFFDDDWDTADLKDAVSDPLDYVCYAYGKLDRADEADETEESGYLSRLKDVGDTAEVYDWAFRNLDYIAGFVKKLEVLSRSVTEKIDAAIENARNKTWFIPFVRSVKGVLDSGCSIHDRVENGDEVSTGAYIEFFKHVALVAVEIVLLAMGFSVGYKTAYGVTGWVNQRLINAVGRRIGWGAYSWVLSQIHWGVRVAFAEQMGDAITETVEAVTARVVSASQSADNPVSKKTARQQAQSHVETMAEQTDRLGVDYELWDTKRDIRQRQQKVAERVESVKQTIHGLI